VPRTARAIHLVINIPDPVAPPAAEPASAKSWARVWTVLKIAGPVSVSIAAIIIAILSLQAQSFANQQEQRAGKAVEGNIKGQDAEQVSFLQRSTPKPPYEVLTVENHGSTPVYIVSFQVVVIPITKTGKSVSKLFTVWLGDVPACSSGTIDIAPVAETMIEKSDQLKLAQIRSVGYYVASMHFLDSNGLEWQYTSAGFLQESQAIPEAPSSNKGYLQADYKSAVGCA
jgi:hypothetical protein